MVPYDQPEAALVSTIYPYLGGGAHWRIAHPFRFTFSYAAISFLGLDHKVDYGRSAVAERIRLSCVYPSSVIWTYLSHTSLGSCVTDLIHCSRLCIVYTMPGNIMMRRPIPIPTQVPPYILTRVA